MKKFTIACSSLLFLVSCGKETVVVMQPASTEPVVIEDNYSSRLITEEQMLIDFVESQVGSLYGVDLQMLVDTGYMICGELRLGATLEDIINIIIAASSGQETDRFLAALAFGSANYLCPDQIYKFNVVTS